MITKGASCDLLTPRLLQTRVGVLRLGRADPGQGDDEKDGQDCGETEIRGVSTSQGALQADACSHAKARSLEDQTSLECWRKPSIRINDTVPNQITLSYRCGGNVGSS